MIPIAGMPKLQISLLLQTLDLLQHLVGLELLHHNLHLAVGIEQLLSQSEHLLLQF